MAQSTQKYRTRPANLFDVPAVTQIYASAFVKEPLIDFFFPTRRQEPESYYTWAYRRFQCRYWTPGYLLTVVVDSNDHPVGFSWWKRPLAASSLLQKVFTPSFWVESIVKAVTAVKNYLSPVHGFQKKNMEAFEQAFSKVESEVLDTAERREAQYLTLLAVDPVYQGQGLGQLLLEHDLERVDEEKSTAWLLSLAGLEPFYEEFGFQQTVKVDVEEMGEWKGGMVMLRD
ncbi:uncharacterized protein FIESC28_02177 [Fusarium coffeatum]|uniref:N-acetyltransferase domain-containing protein n=1 Tax=Fusarium coffeatum TaxID=231269 RepID=A0A366S6V1_9HYPO|nr:uncharacterized protein FIESC28_02177 [Fusarium coffeatum]RBR25053.1 hypothetical protein FIESC28_02177 [Fusarium coffeatum]